MSPPRNRAKSRGKVRHVFTLESSDSRVYRSQSGYNLAPVEDEGKRKITRTFSDKRLTARGGYNGLMAFADNGYYIVIIFREGSATTLSSLNCIRYEMKRSA